MPCAQVIGPKTGVYPVILTCDLKNMVTTFRTKVKFRDCSRICCRVRVWTRRNTSPD